MNKRKCWNLTCHSLLSWYLVRNEDEKKPKMNEMVENKMIQPFYSVI